MRPLEGKRFVCFSHIDHLQNFGQKSRVNASSQLKLSVLEFGFQLLLKRYTVFCSGFKTVSKYAMFAISRKGLGLQVGFVCPQTFANIMELLEHVAPKSELTWLNVLLYWIGLRLNKQEWTSALRLWSTVTRRWTSSFTKTELSIYYGKPLVLRANSVELSSAKETKETWSARFFPDPQAYKQHQPAMNTPPSASLIYPAHLPFRTAWGCCFGEQV
jgi:hypothetical protein